MEFMTSPLMQNGGLLSSPLGILLVIYAGGVAYEKFIKNHEWDYAFAWPLRRIADIKEHFDKKDGES